MTKYALAEKFRAPQGEGLFTGTPMAFLRFIGCSVGKQVCTHCDTEFLKILPGLGGGTFTSTELVLWAGQYPHICLSGGEPLDRDLEPLINDLQAMPKRMVHIETSGTVRPKWVTEGWLGLWITVSPKPGYLPEMISLADEIKVILGGLGDGPGWPTIGDALRWADNGKLVFLQPRNGYNDIDREHLDEALKICTQHPQLRLSVQLHKFLRTR